LYNTNKLIYKSGFFNKFKESLPIVSWFLREEEKKKKATAPTGVTDVRKTHEGAGLSGPQMARPGPRKVVESSSSQPRGPIGQAK
jgi:hypothetical protein